MIKVNLLGTPPGAATAREWLPRDQRPGAIGVALLFATGLAISGGWYYLGSTQGDLATRIATSETELVRLKEASRLVERTETRKAQLAARLDLIGRLGGAKRAPVNLLEAVSRSLPEGLWLLELRQSGTTVEVDGRALSITAITDFSQDLQASGIFQHPVEILTTSAETLEEAPVVRFTVRAAVAPTAPAVAPGAQVPAAGPAASPGATGMLAERTGI